MEAEFRAPKRRPRVYEVYETPLPLNQDRDQDQDQDQDRFRADLINQQVLVQNPDHIRTIYRQGFFGKGVLSRSGPVHSVSAQWENHEGLMFPVVSSSRYEELLRWAGQTLSAQGLDEAAVRHRLQQVSSSLTVDEVRVETQARDDQIPKSRPGPGFSVPGGGFVLVRSDPEGDAEIRRVPISVTEFLQLGHEEAFFLVYALGVLTVYHNQAPVSVLQLWRMFCALRPDFVSLYAAYHFYRSRGWVPKTGSGAKYGTDMMLYRKGPPFYHASFSVVVQRRSAEEEEEQRRSAEEEQRRSAEEEEEQRRSAEEEEEQRRSAEEEEEQRRSAEEEEEQRRSAEEEEEQRRSAEEEEEQRRSAEKEEEQRRSAEEEEEERRSAEEEEEQRRSAEPPERLFSWRSLSALSRVTANVSKELLLCYVIFPADQSEAELRSPDCLHRLTVQEVMVSRWVSSKERADPDEI